MAARGCPAQEVMAVSYGSATDRSVAALIMIMVVALAAGCSNGSSAGTAPTTAPSGPNSAAPSGPAPSAPPTEPATPSPSADPQDGPAPADGSVRVQRTVADGLNVPWGFAVLPGGDELMITSRDTAMITMINLSTGDRTEVGQVPGVVPGGRGEGGLLGLALSPDFEQDQLIFVYYTSSEDNRIVRHRYHADRESGDQLSGGTVILSGIPAGGVHNGGRLAFGPDGMLYATTGEVGNPELAQDRGSLGGKILRMTPDGRPAPGNPDRNSVIWTHGHRNVQGIAWDRDGRLWASEFGQNAADELNLIEPGNNYGWPEAEGASGDDRFTDPVAEWGTDEDSPSGIAVAGGSVWMAALQGERLWRIPLDGNRPAAEPDDFLIGEYGRLRSVVALDDDTLLVGSSNTDGRGDPADNDDRILELTVR